MYGLLGPNGARKSTLMRILATLQAPDAGTARLIDPSLGGTGDADVLRERYAVRRTLGYLPWDSGIYPNVSAEALLDHFAILERITDRRARKATIEALFRRTNL
jgi:ABC-type multidrug transport system ATPase subunit